MVGQRIFLVALSLVFAAGCFYIFRTGVRRYRWIWLLPFTGWLLANVTSVDLFSASEVTDEAQRQGFWLAAEIFVRAMLVAVTLAVGIFYFWQPLRDAVDE